MKKLVFGTMLIGFASLVYSQNSDCGKNTIHLTGVEVSPVDQVYLKNVAGGTVSPVVLDLQKQVSRFNIKESSFYDFNSNKYQTYVITFRGYKGKILAKYDQSGKMVNSIENYKDVPLPRAVRNAAYKEHPDWDFYGSSYSVNYNGKNANKMYKVQMKNNNEKENLKFSIDGKRVD